MTDLILLATLLPGPKHGYQLKLEAGIILGHERLHNNLVYPLLRRFMNHKWVSRRTVPGARGQTRHRYAITALGRRELVSRLSSFTEQDARSSDAFRLHVGLFQLLKPKTRALILDSREKYLAARLGKLTIVEEHFRLDHYANEVVLHFRNEARSELGWIKRLRSGEKGSRNT